MLRKRRKGKEIKGKIKVRLRKECAALSAHPWEPTAARGKLREDA